MTPPNVTTPPHSIPALLAAAAERHGDSAAVIDGDVQLSYGDLLEQSRTFAAALVAGGLQVGDRVSIWLYNGSQWIVAALGVWSAGGTVVPINTRFKGAEAAVILGRSGATVL